MNIFETLYSKLPEFKAYLVYHKEEKEGNVNGSMKPRDCVVVIDKAIPEPFYPQRAEKYQTTQLCCELAVGSATALITELMHPKKATHHYLLAVE